MAPTIFPSPLSITDIHMSIHHILKISPHTLPEVISCVLSFYLRFCRGSMISFTAWVAGTATLYQSRRILYHPRLIHSFIHSFLHSFIDSSIHPFTHSFTHSFIHSFIHSPQPSGHCSSYSNQLHHKVIQASCSYATSDYWSM